MSMDASKNKGRIVDLGSGKTMVLPDIYGDEETVDSRALSAADAPQTDEGESFGFDPYDTAKLFSK